MPRVLHFGAFHYTIETIPYDYTDVSRGAEVGFFVDLCLAVVLGSSSILNLRFLVRLETKVKLISFPYMVC